MDALLEADIKAQKVGSKHSLDKEGYWRAFWDNGAGRCMFDRFNRAAFYVASFWYTAWVNAGRPELDLAVRAEKTRGEIPSRVVIALALVLVVLIVAIAITQLE